jgi:multidrug efflux system outer membrane protein
MRRASLVEALPVRVALAVLGCATLQACTVGPSFRRPEVEMPAAWSQGQGAVLAPVSVAWWKEFRDPILDGLVDKALADNLDVATAAERVLAARGQSRAVRGALLPQLDSRASYAQRQTAGNATGIPNIPGVEGSLLQAGFDASWEIDLFGGRRRALEAARGDVEAAEYQRGDVTVTVIGEIARHYVELRGAQLELDVARRNLADQRESLAIVRARERGGLTSGLDVARASAQADATSSAIPALEAYVLRSAHRLAVLVGEQPGALAAQLATSKPLPSAPAALPAVLPSDLLRRRPDLRAAESRLASATARIGVATADLYPRISLVGAAGLASVSASDFFRADSLAWSIGPTISWPIFRGGQIVATIEVRESEARQALIAWRASILAAMEEVENAIVTLDRERQRRAALAAAVRAQLDGVAIAEEQYRRGLRDYLAVLDARRSLFEQQTALARSETSVCVGLVALHKALGGGWEDGTSEPDALTAGGPNGSQADGRGPAPGTTRSSSLIGTDTPSVPQAAIRSRAGVVSPVGRQARQEKARPAFDAGHEVRRSSELGTGPGVAQYETFSDVIVSRAPPKEH